MHFRCLSHMLPLLLATANGQSISKIRVCKMSGPEAKHSIQVKKKFIPCAIPPKKNTYIDHARVKEPRNASQPYISSQSLLTHYNNTNNNIFPGCQCNYIISILIIILLLYKAVCFHLVLCCF